MEAKEHLLQLCKGTHTKHLRDIPQADKGISTSNRKISVLVTEDIYFVISIYILYMKNEDNLLEEMKTKKLKCNKNVTF